MHLRRPIGTSREPFVNNLASRQTSSLQIVREEGCGFADLHGARQPAHCPVNGHAPQSGYCRKLPRRRHTRVHHAQQVDLSMDNPDRMCFGTAQPGTESAGERRTPAIESTVQSIPGNCAGAAPGMSSDGVTMRPPFTENSARSYKGPRCTLSALLASSRQTRGTMP